MCKALSRMATTHLTILCGIKAHSNEVGIIQMMAQKDITWKIQMMLLKRETKENKKQKQKNKVTQNMEERY